MILTTRGGQKAEFRTTNLASFGIQAPWSSGMASSGVAVTPASGVGVPAVLAAVRLASQAVAVLDLTVWRGRGPDRKQVSTTWQARFLAGDYNEQQTNFEFKCAVEESISYRGNAFIWKNKDPQTGRVVEWFALHPDQVLPLYFRDGAPRQYLVGIRPGFVDPVGKGQGFYEVGEDTILHIKGFGDGGSWIAPSPLDRVRGGAAIGTALAKISHENSMYAQGASPRIAISFPQAMNPEQMRQWRDLFREQYEGPSNTGKTLALGGGATFSQIGLTMADAQFIESQQFSIDEVARIFSVSPALIGGGGAGGTARAVAALTPEHESNRWMTYHLGPRLSRIEDAIYHDDDLFPDGSKDYPEFNSSGVVRGDITTEDAIAHQQVQDGRLLVDEWRQRNGLPPLPGGAGMVPVVNPTGAGATPDQFLPPSTTDGSSDPAEAA